jgi:hypothetical protein
MVGWSFTGLHLAEDQLAEVEPQGSVPEKPEVDHDQCGPRGADHQVAVAGITMCDACRQRLHFVH